jgi:hypothetical protein
MMEPIDRIPASLCGALRYFFCDIDDTMTEHGLLPADAYRALWELSEAGIRVVPVTGRPAGWCDMIARFWPVAAVVGENGAFYFSYERSARKMHRVELGDPAEREQRKALLDRARDRALREVPGSAVAADQPFRLTDLAIDFCEDVAPLTDTDIERICAICREEGLSCKVSSIHVNAWYGEYDKVQCVRRLVRDFGEGSLETAGGTVAFIGDSPNDEPLFGHLPVTIGVANVVRFRERMGHLPQYVTEGDAARGFVEAVHTILAKRA